VLPAFCLISALACMRCDRAPDGPIAAAVETVESSDEVEAFAVEDFGFREGQFQGRPCGKARALDVAVEDLDEELGVGRAGGLMTAHPARPPGRARAALPRREAGG